MAFCTAASANSLPSIPTCSGFYEMLIVSEIDINFVVLV